MRILVVSSCGKKKRMQSHKVLNCDDLTDNASLSKWQSELSHSVLPARDMYTGHQNRQLVAGVDGLRAVRGIKVDLHIISAGFGMLNENTLIPPYECSFNNMKKAAILERAERLGIEEDLRDICRGNYDLLYIALSKKYMIAIGEQFLCGIDGTTVVFHKQKMGSGAVYVPSGSAAVKCFSQQGFKIHGVAGFKGDLLRILMTYAREKKNAYSELHSWKDPFKLRTIIYKLGRLEEGVSDE